MRRWHKNISIEFEVKFIFASYFTHLRMYSVEFGLIIVKSLHLVMI